MLRLSNLALNFLIVGCVVAAMFGCGPAPRGFEGRMASGDVVEFTSREFAAGQGDAKSVQSPEYELVTVDDQIRADLMDIQTSFVIPHDKSLESWERATTFFNSYTNPGDKNGMLTVKAAKNRSATLYILSNSGSEVDPYLFEVKRANVQDGDHYKVTCLAKLGDKSADQQLANQNAKNLARFIQSGELEVSLLRNR